MNRILLKKVERGNLREIIINHETHEIHEQPEKYEKILSKEECYAIQGAVFEVYRDMGCGFLEAVYQ